MEPTHPVPAEKTCPQCAETVKGAALVCRYCGHRFYEEAESFAGMGDARGRGILAWAGVSAGLMIIGSFGPWIDALGQSVSGTDGSNDGWFVVAVAVAGALFMYGTRANRGAGLWALVAGGIGAVITIHDRSHVSHAIANGGALVQAVSRIGWGLNLAMAASISLAFAGVVWLLGVPSVQTIGDAVPADAPDPAETARPESEET